MSLDEVITGLPGFVIRSGKETDKIRIDAVYQSDGRCIHCGCDHLRKKDRFIRKVKHISFGHRPSELHVLSFKYHCQGCGKYFNQRFPGILPRRRSSELFRREVYFKHRDGISQSALAHQLGLGSATVERWFQDVLRREVAKRSNAPCPRILGIDEHFFTKKQGYATTFCNLGRHNIFDVTLGRSEKSLRSYLHRLEGKERVKVMVMDLSESYRSIARKHFPNALVVTDRFHVIRLVNHHFMATWKHLDPEGRKNRGLLSLMRRHEEKLRPEQKENLRGYLDEVPGLASIYDFKQDLCRLLLHKAQTQYQCRRLIPAFLEAIEALKGCGFESLERLGETLERWKDEIARMWRFTKTNGITEGFHNKMEMISRRAFGFRNFENYRLRVRCLCA